MDYFLSHHFLHKFFPFPKYLLNLGLSPMTMIIYMRLYDRNFLSQRNGWYDEKDRVYIIYPIKELAHDARCSERTVMKALKELEKRDMIDRSRIEPGGVNRIYVKVPWMDITDRPSKEELEFLLGLDKMQ